VNRTTSLLVAALFAAFISPSQLQAQSTNVRTPNKNQSAKFKSAIFKGAGNVIQSNAMASFIGGGQSNVITANSTNVVITGGFANTASTNFSMVGGGASNSVTGSAGFIGGGVSNVIAPSTGDLAFLTNHAAFIGGGELNFASGVGATIAGGRLNTNTGDLSAIGGGTANLASGSFSTVPGGIRGHATHDSSFVWADGTGGPGPTTSFGINTFTVRCSGGARFLSSANSTPAGVQLLPNATAWTALSDRESKTDFRKINPREVLAKLTAMPVSSWKYKHDPSRRYIGPTSQDFMAAFHLGAYDKGINTLDADGVTFAAIQGLVEELKDRDTKIERLEAKSAEMESLKAKLQALEERLNSLPPQ
jgi:hypothetical protein